MTVTVSISSRTSANPDNSGVSLVIQDDTSRERVVEVTFTFEEFARVLMNQLTPGISARFGELARVGLVPKSSKRTFDSYTQREEADEFAKRSANTDGPFQRTSVSHTNDGKTAVTQTHWKKP